MVFQKLETLSSITDKYSLEEKTRRLEESEIGSTPKSG
jgi:hypothetical protein